MISLVLQLLRYDRAKYIAMVMAIALASFLIQNQASILGMSGSQIKDVREANLWIMEPDTECFDQAKPLRDTALQTVSGIPGIDWAVPLIKVDTNARTDDGKLRTVPLLGVDGTSRIGEPRMCIGSASPIYLKGNAIVDPGGWELLFPGTSYTPGRSIRIHDQWLNITGISNASPPFTGLPVLHVSDRTAKELARGETRTTTFIVGRSSQDPDDLSQYMSRATNWRAYSREGFQTQSYTFYEGQGVPMIFYSTIAIGLTVGAAFTAQTFIMFIKENARGITMLKVLGVTHGQLAVMLAAQALMVMLLGLSLGTGIAAFVTESITSIPFLRGHVTQLQPVTVFRS
jgi:putative ABC transport system permease protein